MRRRDRRRPLLAAVLAVTVVAACGKAASPGLAEPAAACAPPQASTAYTARTLAVLRSGQDVLGNRLLRSRGGPTYLAARGLLAPLFLARGRNGPLTASGVHYVPFAQPLDARGAGSVALHVADGSQILANSVDGRRLTVSVGGGRCGARLARLARPELAEGWLPILETSYRDGSGRSYRQESFSTRLSPAQLTSFVKVTLVAGSPAAVRIAGLRRTIRAVLRSGESLVVAWPQTGSVSRTDEAAYSRARAELALDWERRLGTAASFDVPEQVVLDAERALLVQNLALTWRYSIGNPYEEFSFPEGIDNAEVAAAYGLDGVARAILRTSLTRRATPYPNWRMGEKLLGFALHYRLYRDAAFVAQATPVLRRYVAVLGRQIEVNRNGLLDREQYSSDIHDSVYGLHAQAVVWQALREMGAAWDATGRRELAKRCRALAQRLGTGLRTAVRSSSRRLPDGSLFVPVRLLDDERPYGALTASRPGSYWNLVMPYALASGLLPPVSDEARGVLRYVLNHGSRLLGLVRASAFALYKTPVFPVSGTDQVYGLNMARFLADEDEPDQLALSLYGQLAAGMTEGTFVSGEGATVAPLDGASYRSMYLPPNSTSNGAFLETLRLMLVHERRGPDGRPRGLELAFATPRAWLEPGKRIRVDRAPTSFGPLAYELEAGEGEVRATIAVPARPAPRTLRLRLRLPGGGSIRSVELDGRPFDLYNRGTGTIDLSGRKGTLHLLVRHG